MSCNHSNISFVIDPQAFDDTNVRQFTLRARCAHCHEPFRFIGVDEGISLLKPSLGADGLSVHIPAVMELEEPEGDRRMAS